MAQVGPAAPSMPCEVLSQRRCRVKCVQQVAAFHFEFPEAASFHRVLSGGQKLATAQM